MENLYNCEDVAQRYGVQVLTVWEWIRKKKLPAIRIGKSYRVRESDMQKFEASRRTVHATYQDN